MNVAGIIPAAGYASRLQPLPCSKEVYPVGGRPVMDYVMERMRAANCRDIRVITRPEKRDVVQNARRQGVSVIEGRPASLAASIRLGLDGLDDRDIVLLGFPDTVWEPVDGYVRLVTAVEHGRDAALGLFPVSDPETCDAVVCDRRGRVVAVESKSPAPSTNVIWGCATIRAEALRGWDPDVDIGVHLGLIARTRSVVGVTLSDRFLDIGKSRRALREEA